MKTDLDIKREVAYKAYRKLFKKQKKELVKRAKQFKAFDYGFIDKLLFQVIRMFYDFYKNPDLLYQDTESEFNDWPSMVNSLKRCVEIVDIIENVDYDSCTTERELRDELFNLIRDNHTAWWD